MSSLSSDAKNAKTNPEWVPPDDSVFQHLLMEAAAGRLSVYFAVVPFSRLRRFAPTFHPENTNGGGDVVAEIMRHWRAGDFHKMWVYPKGEHFIVSDDYFTLAAAERGQPDFVPCWVLGMVSEGYATDVQGPIDPEWVRKTLLS